ncbi:phosphate/phosphite/phosphonate ABC transporter substrate-binding protein [Steroidobacter flavus]|uniref:Phosphate/phosphite/phosphonate ABC transporter substrate-binding protein n=1 Tax=Steroidobacter flavus TaxID=1842136 RepID=A0ABV8T5D8_9GAMM
MSVTRPRPLVLGAVATDPKVVTVWDAFQRYFIQRGLPFEYVLYSNYEQQVRNHFDGQCHVALNSPLAWIEVERLAVAHGRKASAIAMRDSDRDLHSVIVSRRDSDIAGIADLKGRRVAVGAKDSPQATLVPLDLIAQAGLAPGTDFEVIYLNACLGKHCAEVDDACETLMSGKVDACCLLDAHYSLFEQETQIVATTEPFDNYNLTVLDGAPQLQIERFVALLLAMSPTDPQARALLDMADVKQWLPGRLSGYVALHRAVDRFGPVSRTFR